MRSQTRLCGAFRSLLDPSSSSRRCLSTAAGDSFTFAAVSVKKITLSFTPPDAAPLTLLPSSLSQDSSLILSSTTATRFVSPTELDDLSFFPSIANASLASSGTRAAPKKLVISKRALEKHLRAVSAASSASSAGPGSLPSPAAARLLAEPAPVNGEAVQGCEPPSAANGVGEGSPTSSSLVLDSASNRNTAVSLVSLRSAPSSPLHSLTSAANTRARAYYASATARSAPSETPALTSLMRELVAACVTGDLTLARAILSEHPDELTGGAEGSVAQARLERGGGPLHHAAAGGHVDVVTFLVDHMRVPVDVRAANDSTPLHWAAGNGHADVTRALLARGAAADARTSTWCVDTFGKASGQTPLHWAAESGYTECVALLAAAAPGVVGAADEKDATPVQLAKKEGMHPGTVKALEEALEEEYVCVEVRVEEAASTKALF